MAFFILIDAPFCSPNSYDAISKGWHLIQIRGAI
jgi:hypothetical protein